MSGIYNKTFWQKHKFFAKFYIRNVMKKFPELKADKEIYKWIINYINNYEPIETFVEFLKKVNIKFPVKLTMNSYRNAMLNLQCNSSYGKNIKISLEYPDKISIFGDNIKRYYTFNKEGFLLNKEHLRKEKILLENTYTNVPYNNKSVVHKLFFSDYKLEITANIGSNERNLFEKNQIISQYLLSIPREFSESKFSMYYQVIKMLYMKINEYFATIPIFELHLYKKNSLNEYIHLLKSITFKKGILTEYISNNSENSICWDKSGFWEYITPTYIVKSENSKESVEFFDSSDNNNDDKIINKASLTVAANLLEVK